MWVMETVTKATSYPQTPGLSLAGTSSTYPKISILK